MKPTIQEIFLQSASSEKGAGITFIDELDTTDHISYKKLYLEACYKLHALQERGLSPGDELIFQFEANRNFVITFWACVLGKIIPVPVAFASGAATVRKIAGIWKRLNNPYVISDNSALKATLSTFQDEDEAFGQMLDRFIAFDELKNSRKAAVVPADPSDILFIQFSSGSTGSPKGVINTHEATLYNFKIYDNLSVNSEDRFLGWVPLIHDMGLIFFHIVPLLANADHFLMPASLFITYPELWMEKISEHQVTVSGCPNFGYRMILDNISRVNTDNLELSQLRLMINSAEPVSINDCRAFEKAFAPYGLRKNAVRASYGLAEAVLGVSLNKSDDEESREYYLDRSKLNVGDEVNIVKAESAHAGAFANLGIFEFTEVSVVDDNDSVLPDKTLGYIRLKSPAITKGYYNDPESTKKVISEDGWLNTGDIGFIDNEQLFLTGRAKEMIIINGQNYFPNDIDYVLSEIPELNFQQAVACSVFNDRDHKDEIFVFVLFKDTAEKFNVLATEIRTHISNRLGLEVSKVIPVGQIPKTTSGKIQRYILRDRYFGGDYNDVLADLNDGVDALEIDQYTAPTTDTERRLAKVWEQYFDIERVGTEANFYFLGGNSIGLGKLGSLIAEAFNISLDIRKLLACASFLDQVALIENTSKESALSGSGDTPAKAHYPLFTTQKRFFALHQADEQSVAYNIPTVINIEGNLDFERCEEAFTEIIQRHEILRTSFEVLDGNPVQKIHEDFDFNIEVVEDGEADALLKKHVRPFDMSAPPLLRVFVCKNGESYTKFILDVHHIVVDGASFEILIEEFQQLYAKKSLAPLELQYRDFVEWQEEKLAGSNLESQQAYWMDVYSEPVETLNLPTDVAVVEEEVFDGESLVFDLGEETESKLREFCKNEQLTMSGMTLAMFYILLSKLTTREDIVVGISSFGRWKKEFNALIGLFIDTLPIRSDLSGNQKFSELVQSVQGNVLNGIENGDYSFEELYQHLKIEHNSSNNSLINTAFEYFDFDWTIPESADLHLSKDSQRDNMIAKFPLALRVFDNGEGLKLHLDYSTNSFTKASVERFSNYYQEIVRAVIENNSIALGDIKILSDIEIDEQLTVFNDTALLYDKTQSLVTLFEQQVAVHPDRIAIAYEGETLTYQELDDRSNQVANCLVTEGTIPNVVGLLIDRSLDMIVGMWGALKVGAGYLPLDPSLPEERIRYMLDQSGATFLLTHERYLDAYSAYLPVQSIDSSQITSNSTERVDFETAANDLAYCIFTSGSTGKPKGVMINHGNVINLVKGLEERVYQSYGDQQLRVALLASFAFDASGQQIYGALLQGHSLYIAGDETRKDGVKLNAFLNDNQIDVTDGTPTHLRILVNTDNEGATLQSLSSWLLAGEVLSKDLVSNFYKNFGEKTQLYNFYGPTETCVDSTSYKIDPALLEDLNTIPIGKPLPNERAYVTDANGNLVPVGVVGELCIAGDGLAQRYVGDQALTTEKFASDWIAGESRVYRTGDMVRWLPDGNLEYSGRKDNQVKLRGYRIELGEIEKQLNANAAIQHAVVLAKKSEDEHVLVAYYQAGEKIEVSELRDYLGKFLPDYMVPSYYVHVAQFELTLTGKVDNKALPDYNVDVTDQVITPPANEVERTLAGIYAKVLGIDVDIIGRESSFVELGGHSLKMIYLANSIEKEFSVRLSLKQIIDNPSLEKISALVPQSSTSLHGQIPVSENLAYYPLSTAQKRMYFAHQYDKKSLSYNVRSVFTLKGALNEERLEAAFNELISRHDSLRTEFVMVDRSLSQRILPEVDFSIDYLKNDSDLDQIIKKFTRPFDLDNAPLLRVGIVEISDIENVLIMDSHHIIADEVTSAILFRDLSNSYNGERLPELRVQYKDFVMWQNEAQQQNEIERQKTYWVEKFSNHIPTLELPYDFARGERNSDNGGSLALPIDPSNAEKLKQAAKNEGITLYSMYLSVFNILMYKLSGQKDIIVGTPVAGRPHHDLEGITGVFINTLPIRNQLEEDMTFTDFAQQVQKGNAADFDQQSYPYLDLVDELGLKRDLTRNPLFDVSFNYVNGSTNLLSMTGLDVAPYHGEYTQSKFDLNMTVIERSNDDILFVEYAKGLFREETVSRFIDQFNAIIESICNDQATKIADIQILEEIETENLITDSSMSHVNQDPDTIVSTFEKQVSATPHAIAVKYGTTAYTYAELNQKANQFARSLQQEHDVFKGDIVGILLPKSDQAVISILATLKLGAVYLPIDTNYPVERIKYIVENSGLNALITDRKSCPEEVGVDSKVYFEYVEWNKSTDNLGINISSTDLAYVIYTSGSTGKPKGAMIEHGSNVNMSTDIVKQLDVNDRDTILWFASIGFDASVYEIMMAFYGGATLVIPEEGVINDTERFCSLLSATGTTIITLPPSYLETLPLEKLTTLRIVTTAGEAANAKKAIQVIKSGIRYFNAYGPTECAVCVSTYEVSENDEGQINIPIGKPIANTEMVILDDDFRPVFPGVKGTIYVAGKGVGRGYLNNPELTTKGFVKLPHDASKTYYNTGDLGEWNAAGQIVFHGRKDNQIKLRGYRIELGEIGGALASIDEVRNCHVTLREGPTGEKELIAFVIKNGALDKAEMEQSLGKLLPEYMVPRTWMQLDEFPVTSNGKIDTSALLALEVEGTDAYVAASSEIETTFVKIWSEVLEKEIDTIGVNDDFFDLGGNSLLAIQVLTAVNKHYGIQLELQEIFRLKTISSLSEFIELNLWVNDDNEEEMEYTETVI